MSARVRVVLRVPPGSEDVARAAARRVGIPEQLIEGAVAEGGAELRTDHLSAGEIGALVAELAEAPTSELGMARLHEPRYVHRRRARRELILVLEDLITRHGLTLADLVSVATTATSAIVDRLFVFVPDDSGSPPPTPESES